MDDTSVLDSTSDSMTPDQIQQEMQKNSDAWNNATDQATRDALHQQNVDLAAKLGASENNYDAATGTWNLPSGYSSGSSQTSTPSQDSSAPVSSPSSLPTAYRTSSGENVTNEGNAHINVGGSQVDVPIHQGSSYAPLSDIEKITGMQATKDPATGNIMLGGKTFQPVGYDANGNPMLGVRNTLESLGGYKIDWNQDNNQITVSKDQTKPVQPQQNPMQIPSYLYGMFQNLPQAPQYTPFQMPDMTSYNSQMMPYTQFNPDWNNYVKQAQDQLNPQYQGKYNDLMAKQTTDLQNMDESMNRRGIFSSGVAEAAANDLRAKTTNTIANVFLQQQAAINKTAQQLYNDAYKQYQDGNQMALKNNQFLMTQMMNQEKQAFSQWLDTQKLSQQQYQYAMNAWNQMANMIQKDAFQQQDMNWKDYTFNNLSADQTANLQKQYDQMEQAWQKSQLPYQQMTQYQQAQMDAKQAAQEASNYFKQLGINLDSAKLEELIRHNQASENLQGQKITADITMNQSKFNQQVYMDEQNLQKASDQALDTAKRTQLEGLKSELSSVVQQMNAYVTAQKPAPDDLVTRYNTVKDNIDKVIGANTGGG